jgi:hypothetical protein
MKSKTITKLAKEELKAFLNLSPVERILAMERLLHEMLAIKAEEEGISEGEIYNRYLDRNKRSRNTI